MRTPFLKIIAATLSLALFVTNVAFAHTAETNFWSQRQKAVKDTKENSENPTLLAHLPATLYGSPSQILTGLPAPAHPVAAISKQISQQIPRGLESRYSPLIQALSSSYGTVRKISVPQERRNSSTVIHIQDVHLNPEAQQNIGKTIQELIDQKKVDLVALEGAFGPVDFSVFRKFPYPDSTKAVADYLFKEKKISGAVYTGLTSQAEIPVFIGVDDTEHYWANVEAYKRSTALKKGYKTRLVALENQLNQEKIRTFNKELAEFDAHVQSYRQGKLAWGEYVRFLTTHAKDSSSSIALFLEALNQESSLDFSRVESERTQFITKLVSKLTKDESTDLLNHSVAYRLGNIGHTDFYQYVKDLCQKNQINLAQYKAMDSYIQYVLLSDAINIEKILQDVASIEKSVYETLIKTADESRLVSTSKQTYLTGKLLGFGLTTDEWAEYSTLNNQVSQKIGDLSAFEDFYIEAQNRDKAMTDNLVKVMGQSKASVVVLVTGGFHSEGITEQLKNKGITIITYVPKITKVEDESGSSYLSVFSQEKTPLDRLFAGEKLFVNPPPMVRTRPAIILTMLVTLLVHPAVSLANLLGTTGGTVPTNAVAHVDVSQRTASIETPDDGVQISAVVDENRTILKSSARKVLKATIIAGTLLSIGCSPSQTGIQPPSQVILWTLIFLAVLFASALKVSDSSTSGSGERKRLVRIVASDQPLEQFFQTAHMLMSNPQQIENWGNVVRLIEPLLSLNETNGVQLNSELDGEEILFVGPGQFPNAIIQLLERFPKLRRINILEPHAANAVELEQKFNSYLNSTPVTTELVIYQYTAQNMPPELFERNALVIDQNVFDASTLPEGQKSQLDLVRDNFWRSLRTGGVHITQGLFRLNYPQDYPAMKPLHVAAPTGIEEKYRELVTGDYYVKSPRSVTISGWELVGGVDRRLVVGEKVTIQRQNLTSMMIGVIDVAEKDDDILNPLNNPQIWNVGFGESGAFIIAFGKNSDHVPDFPLNQERNSHGLSLSLTSEGMVLTNHTDKTLYWSLLANRPTLGDHGTSTVENLLAAPRLEQPYFNWIAGLISITALLAPFFNNSIVLHTMLICLGLAVTLTAHFVFVAHEVTIQKNKDLFPTWAHRMDYYGYLTVRASRFTLATLSPSLPWLAAALTASFCGLGAPGMILSVLLISFLTNTNPIKALRQGHNAGQRVHADNNRNDLWDFERGIGASSRFKDTFVLKVPRKPDHLAILDREEGIKLLLQLLPENEEVNLEDVNPGFMYPISFGVKKVGNQIFHVAFEKTSKFKLRNGFFVVRPDGKIAWMSLDKLPAEKSVEFNHAMDRVQKKTADAFLQQSGRSAAAELKETEPNLTQAIEILKRWANQGVELEIVANNKYGQSYIDCIQGKLQAKHLDSNVVWFEGARHGWRIEDVVSVKRLDGGGQFTIHFLSPELEVWRILSSDSETQIRKSIEEAMSQTNSRHVTFYGTRLSHLFRNPWFIYLPGNLELWGRFVQVALYVMNRKWGDRELDSKATFDIDMWLKAFYMGNPEVLRDKESRLLYEKSINENQFFYSSFLIAFAIANLHTITREQVLLFAKYHIANQEFVEAVGEEAGTEVIQAGNKHQLTIFDDVRGNPALSQNYEEFLDNLQRSLVRIACDPHRSEEQRAAAGAILLAQGITDKKVLESVQTFLASTRMKIANRVLIFALKPGANVAAATEILNRLSSDRDPKDFQPHYSAVVPLLIKELRKQDPTGLKEHSQAFNYVSKANLLKQVPSYASRVALPLLISWLDVRWGHSINKISSDIIRQLLSTPETVSETVVALRAASYSEDMAQSIRINSAELLTDHLFRNPGAPAASLMKDDFPKLVDSTLLRLSGAMVTAVRIVFDQALAEAHHENLSRLIGHVISDLQSHNLRGLREIQDILMKLPNESLVGKSLMDLFLDRFFAAVVSGRIQNNDVIDRFIDTERHNPFFYPRLHKYIHSDPSRIASLQTILSNTAIPTASAQYQFANSLLSYDHYEAAMRDLYTQRIRTQFEQREGDDLLSKIILALDSQSPMDRFNATVALSLGVVKRTEITSKQELIISLLKTIANKPVGNVDRQSGATGFARNVLRELLAPADIPETWSSETYVSDISALRFRIFNLMTAPPSISPYSGQPGTHRFEDRMNSNRLWLRYVMEIEKLERTAPEMAKDMIPAMVDGMAGFISSQSSGKNDWVKELFPFVLHVHPKVISYLKQRIERASQQQEPIFGELAANATKLTKDEIGTIQAIANRSDSTVHLAALILLSRKLAVATEYPADWDTFGHSRLSMAIEDIPSEENTDIVPLKEKVLLQIRKAGPTPEPGFFMGDDEGTLPAAGGLARGEKRNLFVVNYWKPIIEQIKYHVPAAIILPGLGIAILASHGFDLWLQILVAVLIGAIGVELVLKPYVDYEHRLFQKNGHWYGYTPEERATLRTPIREYGYLTLGIFISVYLVFVLGLGISFQPDNFVAMTTTFWRVLILSGIIGALAGIIKHTRNNIRSHFAGAFLTAGDQERDSLGSTNDPLVDQETYYDILNRMTDAFVSISERDWEQLKSNFSDDQLAGIGLHLIFKIQSESNQDARIAFVERHRRLHSIILARPRPKKSGSQEDGTLPTAGGQERQDRQSIASVQQLAQEIRREYQTSGAQAKVVSEVIHNIESRQGKPSFDLAHAIRPQVQSTEVQKTFAIGLALAIKRLFGFVFDSLKAALAKAFNTDADLVTLVNVNDENDLDKVRDAIEAAKKHNKDTNKSLAVVGVVVAKDTNGTLAQVVQEEISRSKSGVPIAVVREGDLEFQGEQIPYAALFNSFYGLFEQQRVAKAQELFYELAQDNVNDKKVIIVGVSRTPYQASERLLSIMISLIPIQGRVLMINMQSILEAAKMA